MAAMDASALAASAAREQEEAAAKAQLELVDVARMKEGAAAFKAFLKRKELGFGQVLLPFRIALTGEGGGPSMFAFAAFLGLDATLDRLTQGKNLIAQQRAEA